MKNSTRSIIGEIRDECDYKRLYPTKVVDKNPIVRDLYLHPSNRRGNSHRERYTLNQVMNGGSITIFIRYLIFGNSAFDIGSATDDEYKLYENCFQILWNAMNEVYELIKENKHVK